MNVFSNYIIKTSINSLGGTILTWSSGFGMMVDFNTSYYVIDYSANRIYLLNDDFAYVAMKTFSTPNYMITVSSSLYITGNKNIWKTDKYLNILMTYSSTTVANYNGILFNYTENLIYVTPFTYTYLEVFDLNLNLKSIISVSPHNPRSLAEYNNALYVGTMVDLVLVVLNKAIIRSFTACSSTRVSSMIFDEFGLVAIACRDNNLVKLFHSNGTYTTKNFVSTTKPMYAGFDSKCRFIVSLSTILRIYY
jgi:hypothetical protein